MLHRYQSVTGAMTLFVGIIGIGLLWKIGRFYDDIKNLCKVYFMVTLLFNILMRRLNILCYSTVFSCHQFFQYFVIVSF